MYVAGTGVHLLYVVVRLIMLQIHNIVYSEIIFLRILLKMPYRCIKMFAVKKLYVLMGVTYWA
jgi:hypothetical protein